MYEIPGSSLVFFGKNDPLAWKALWSGQKPSVEISGKDNKLKARMI